MIRDNGSPEDRAHLVNRGRSVRKRRQPQQRMVNVTDRCRLRRRVVRQPKAPQEACQILPASRQEEEPQEERENEFGDAFGDAFEEIQGTVHTPQRENQIGKRTHLGTHLKRCKEGCTHDKEKVK
jgi:hypothetical protein